MFFRRKPKTQKELVALGDQARGRGKVKKAIAKYQAALALGPDDPAIHGKLAPLLARSQQADAAMKSFQAAAEGQLAKGFTDRAIAVWAQAAQSFPRQVRVWQEMARLHGGRGRRADAVKALLEGRGHLRKKAFRREALVLLRQALELEPGHVEVRIDLARQLGKLGQREEALATLRPLEGTAGKLLRRVRRAQFQISPSVRTLWRWLRA